MTIEEEVKTAIENAIPGAVATVTGGGGHFEIEVTSKEFEGKRILEKQRLVYSAITHLMAGDAAPVHAVDRMVCKTE
jgi:acid stress-induced BolA-like protein IbaG/YrbA